MNVQWEAYKPVINDNSKKSPIELVSDFTATDLGVFRVLYLIEKTAKVASYALKSFGNSLSVYFDAFARKCSTAWQMLIIPSLPGMTKSALESVEKFRKNRTEERRPAFDMIANVTDAAGGYCLAGAAVLGVVENLPASDYLLNAADGFDFKCKVTKLVMTAEDLAAAREAVNAVKGNENLKDVHQNFVETQRYQFIKLAETVAGTATGAIGLAALIFGAPALPSIVATVIGLGRTITAIGNHFYKETRENKIVNMYSARFSLETV
jgi:hypothetical protein